MNALLQRLTQLGIRLSIEGEQLAVEAPHGLPEDLRHELISHKTSLLALLRDNCAGHELPKVIERPDQRYEPFALTGLQQAYAVGRRADVPGGAAMHAFNEIACRDLDVAKLEKAWNTLVQRHEMLRAVLVDDFSQRIQPSVPHYPIVVEDLRDRPAASVQARLEVLRERLRHQVHAVDRWPWFELRVCLLDSDQRLFMSVDGTFVDGFSFQILYRELCQLYSEPAALPPPPALSYRDYLAALSELEGTHRKQRAVAYWRERLKTLPPAPDLPLAADPQSLAPRFARAQAHIGPQMWQRIKAQARDRGLTEPELLLACYAEVIALWSGSPRFTLNVPHFNRLRLHPDVTRVIGTFASFALVGVEHAGARTFAERAVAIKRELLAAIDHREVGDVALNRELFKARGAVSTALMPVVFTSFATGVDGNDAFWVDALGRHFGELACALTQTPQVWIDNQATWQDAGVFLNWDYVDGLFPAGMVDDMFASYHRLLLRLAEPTLWDARDLDLLPANHRAVIDRANDTKQPLSDALLHDGFFAQARLQPDAIAVQTLERVIRYGELAGMANQIARGLREANQHANQHANQDSDIIAICMHKGWEQIAASVGVLSAGGACLPMDPELPSARRAFLLQDAGVKRVLVDAACAALDWPEGVRALRLSDFAQHSTEPLPEPPKRDPQQTLCHVLYTSGTTGVPNGARLCHAGMVNAVSWTNQQFGVGPDDRAIALAALHHDFSVYDIFGMLSAGAAVLVPSAAGRRDPAHWLQLMAAGKATLWSTVPAMMEMLLAQLELAGQRPDATRCPLRLVMLGGDWIPVTMPARVRRQFARAKLVSVGGPTETTLWNITHPVQPGDELRSSIPYGRPIANAHYHILSEDLRQRPLGVPGELCCTGVGIAHGYVGRTSPRFVQWSGRAMYRTGDLGRYLPDGTIEFLGRIDAQLSIRGQRIEPGEIEAALLSAAGVTAAVVGCVGEHHDKRLVAWVVGDCDTAALLPHLRERLPPHMVPREFVALAALPLTANAKVDRAALPLPATTTTTTTNANATAATRNRCQAPGSAQAGAYLSARVESLAAAVIGVERLDPDTPFFELGANSVHLVQLAARLSSELGLPVSAVQLFANPTLRALLSHLGAGAASESAAQSQPIASSSPSESEDIAIVAMSCRLPGASDPERFWDNLVAGVESITRHDRKALADNGVLADDPQYVAASGTIEGFDSFDAALFGMTAREARNLDPQQRVFLECAWEALERAGLPPDDCGERRVGVFAGKSVAHYRYPYPDLEQPLKFFEELVALDKDFLTTRLSYAFDLRGPSVNVATACSTSLVAVVMACEALTRGECDVALAGGVAIKVPHEVGYLYEEGSIFSPDGRCRPFDRSASGTVPGSGAGIVVLKRLRDVGDEPVLAVIKGGAVNNDGSRKVGFMAPGVAGQAEVIAQAHRRARVSPDSIGYVEAHGTGTLVGDPIEVAALKRAFGVGLPARSCALGSVKGNVGHLDSAAGVAGLIKAVLMLQHRMLPPTLNFVEPNPALELDESPFFVANGLSPWRSDLPLRAAVSSFGIGGTNAHVVLEQAPERAPAAGAVATLTPPAPELHALAISAHSEAALLQLAQRYDTRLQEAAASDVCFSAAHGRATLGWRLACVGTANELRAGLRRAPTRASAVSMVWLFSGHGGQRLGAGRDLYETEPVFRRRLDGLRIGERSVAELLYGDDQALLDRFDHAQPALYALEVALAELWSSYGVQPDILLGHSTGELAAACMAGVFSAEDGFRMAAERGRLLLERGPSGATLSVRASAERVAEVARQAGLVPSFAAFNAPQRVSLSGTEPEMAALAAALSAQGVEVKRMNIPGAAHSPRVEALLPQWQAFVAAIPMRPPRLALISSMTGAPIGAEIAQAAYWARQLRDPVRFADALGCVGTSGRVFVELGPRPALTALAAENGAEHVWSSLGNEARAAGKSDPRDPRDPRNQLDPLDQGNDRRATLQALGAVWELGVGVNWRAVQRAGRRVAVPTTPVQRQRYWLQGAGLQRPGAAAEAGWLHPLLGREVPVAVQGADQRTYEGKLSLSRQPWLAQHRLEGVATAPAAATAEIVLAAARHALGHDDLVLAALSLETALRFDEHADGADVSVQCAVTLTDDGAQVRVLGRRDGPWVQYAQATLCRRELGTELADIDLEQARAAAPTQETVDAFYARAQHAGIEFGPAFRAVAEVWRGDQCALTRVSGSDVEAYRWTPPLLDACLQAAGALTSAAADTPSHEAVPDLYVPVALHGLDLVGPLEGLWCFARRMGEAAAARDGTVRATLTFFGADGVARGRLAELTLQRVPRAALLGTAFLEGMLFAPRWQRRALEQEVANATPCARVARVRSQHPSGPSSVVLADDPNLREQLCAAIAGARAAQGVQSASAALRDSVALIAVDPSTTSALQLLRQIVEQAWTGKLLLWLPEALQGGPLVGLARTAALELPELRVRIVQGGTASDVARELAADGGEDQVAYLPQRHVCRLGRVSLPTAPPGQGALASLRADRAYVVVGAGGRLGRLTVRWLLARGAGEVIAVGRRRPASFGDRRVRCIAADCTERAALGAALARAELPLAGAFHCAGVIEDGVLPQLDDARLERVLSPKLEGAWNLHLLTKNSALDHFVLFSSVAGVLGSAGQASHAAACASLDALAQQRRKSGLPALSIDWGPWAGAAGADVAVSARVRTEGLGALSIRHGLDVLDALLDSDLAQVAVAAIDWRALADRRPFAEGMQAAQTSQVRSTLADRVAQAPARRRRRLVEQFVSEHVAWICGVEPDALDRQVGFGELGIDSLGALRLRNRVQEGLGQALPVTTFFDFPNVTALAQHIIQRFLSDLAFGGDQDGQQPREDRPQALDEAALAQLLTAQLEAMDP